MPSIPFDIEDFVLESAAFAHVAPQFQIGHELHADGHLAFALARLAAATSDVEAEVGGFVAARLGDACAAEQLPNLVVRLDVRDGVAAGRFANGILVDEFQRADLVHAARQRPEGRLSAAEPFQLGPEQWEEDLIDQGTLPDPLTPVMAVNACRGMRMSTPLRLFL